MTNQSLREGARWGEDPPPPGPPPLLEQLRHEYGEANLQRVTEMREKLRTNFPHFVLPKLDPLIFAQEVLGCAQKSLVTAAHDGRSHSMPETLDALDAVLSEWLIKSPESASLADRIVLYGDEDQGLSAKQEALSLKQLAEARIKAKYHGPVRTHENSGFVGLAPLKKYLSFAGRSRRAEFLQFTALGVPFFVVFAVAHSASSSANFIVIFQVIFVVAFYPAYVSLIVRRLHDFGASGWWAIPALLLVWPLLILGFQRGHYGPNAYGPDPKGVSTEP